LQQKVALQADNRALEAELAKTRSQLSAATNLRAQRDSQIAQLRAELEDSSQQFELHKAKTAELEAQRQEWEAARLRLEVENRDLQLRLEAGSRQYQNLREKAALLEARMAAGEQQIIEMTHYLGSLPEAVHQAGRELRTVAPGSRLQALWHGLAERCAPIFRRGPVRR
jgi:chromosome segregation ATPase